MSKYASLFNTLFIFLLTQSFGTVAIFAAGSVLSSPSGTTMADFMTESSQLGSLPVATLSIIMMAMNAIAVLLCCFPFRYIRFADTFRFATVNWRAGVSPIIGGLLCALSVSILTDGIDSPDSLQQMSLALSHNIWGAVMLVIVGPVTEELLFREAIAGEMLRRGVHPRVAVLLSSLAFGIVHLNVAQCLYALPLGIILGIIYCKCRNVILTTLLHILNNGFVVALLFFFGKDAQAFSYTEWLGGSANAYTVAIIAGILCTVLIFSFWNKYTPLDEEQDEHPTRPKTT